MSTRPTDAELARDFLDGRPGSRDALLERWVPQVLRWAIRLGGPGIHPEDVAQDVCIVIIRRLDDLRDLDRLSPWLYGVTRKVVSQHRRKAWRRRWMPGVAADPVSTDSGPSQLAEATELGHAVHGLLAGLSLRHREVLVLCDLEERPAAEVADMLGIPLGTVKSRLRAAPDRFRSAAQGSEAVVAWTAEVSS